MYIWYDGCATISRIFCFRWIIFAWNSILSIVTDPAVISTFVYVNAFATALVLILNKNFSAKASNGMYVRESEPTTPDIILLKKNDFHLY